MLLCIFLFTKYVGDNLSQHSTCMYFCVSKLHSEDIHIIHLYTNNVYILPKHYKRKHKLKRTKCSINENQQASWKPGASGVQSKVLSLIVTEMESLLKTHLYMALYMNLLNVHGFWWHLMFKALFFFSLKSSISFLVPFFFL